MGKSESGNAVGARVGAPRWLACAPLAISLAALLPGYRSWDPCGAGQDICAVALSALSWIAMGFPHALIYPLIMAISLQASLGVLLAVDGALILAARTWLPERLTLGQISAVWIGWLAATAATILAAPYLMSWAWRAAH